MSLQNHPDYTSEVEKLNYTVNYVKGYLDSVLSHKARIDKEVEYGITHFNSDNAEQFNDLILNTTLQDNLSQKIKDLIKARSKPYFARVDFLESNSRSEEKLYIGKTSLIKEENQDHIVIDWRAPISNLYYEGRIGSASYACPEGAISGEIKLKRQYTIENEELKELYDIDITTNDDFLQACLGSNKDNRLKDIVSSIQAEQNRVIRADMWKPLIVQGAAGGGKTTIALHRIAYLLYAYEKSLSPKNFMIIAPNRFFLSYISEVLPELGVENVRQTTFEDFAFEVIGIKKPNLLEAHHKLAIMINKSSASTDEIEKLKSISKFKSSLKFKTIIEKYLSNIEKSFLPKIDFEICSYVLLSRCDIENLFLKEYSNLPFNKRVCEITKHLQNTLKRQKNVIIDEIEHEYDVKINDARYSMKDSPERRSVITKLTDARDELIKKIIKNSKCLVKDYLNKIKILSPLEYYLQLLHDQKLFCELSYQFLNEKEADELRQHSLINLEQNNLEIEDLAPLMYIKNTIFGLDEKIKIRHMVIDEAQDFSLFQFYVLKDIAKESSFTILGDLCQGIHSYRGIMDWTDIQSKIFTNVSTDFLTLEQSYRTTIEIMEGANQVIKFLNNPSLPPAKPVIRHGDKIKIYEKCSLEEISDHIKKTLKTIKADGYKTCAIICKTLEECESLKKLIRDSGYDIRVIRGSEKDYSGGYVIIPSYLVKGLEFDTVIIANASKDMYTADELDIKLLYVAMTRPLHKLFIYSVGEVCSFLNYLK